MESFLELPIRHSLLNQSLSILRVIWLVRRFLSHPPLIFNPLISFLETIHSHPLLSSLETLLSIQLNQVSCLLVSLSIQILELYLDLLLNPSQLRMWLSKQRIQSVINHSISLSLLVFYQQCSIILRRYITLPSTNHSLSLLNVMETISNTLLKRDLSLLVSHSIHLQEWLKDLLSTQLNSFH